VCSFNAPGAKSVGLSILDGPSYPIILGRSAEIFYVYDGSAIITQINGHDVPVKKGDIVFVPRGVAYGGKNFNHYNMPIWYSIAVRTRYRAPLRR